MLRHPIVVWGYCEENKEQLRAFLKRCAKFKTCKPQDSLDNIVSRLTETLFKSVLNNNNHVLHKFLPDIRPINYNLRNRTHSLELPVLNSLNKKNFIVRMLFNTHYITL